MGSGLNEFETDFGFFAGIGVAKGNAAGLLFSGFRIFDDHQLSEAYEQIQVDERAVGGDNSTGTVHEDKTKASSTRGFRYTPWQYLSQKQNQRVPSFLAGSGHALDTLT